ncbi:MAG: UvrB/UvrC motif-containing protein [Planctomycetota bacterium]|nr:UvrB/UvrC motif-containing protein [Planctomycetota bacterium]
MNHCDFCNKPAVVHEVTVKNGIQKEVHLCQEHAAEIGIDMPDHQPISQLLTKFTVSHSSGSNPSAGSQRRPKRVCDECGLSYAEFRKKGTLGCPNCYDAFEKTLSSLVARAQNNATHHTGKAPKRAGTSLDRQLMIKQLIVDLDSAVAAEQYERAAELRDQISKLEIILPAEDAAETT